MERRGGMEKIRELLEHTPLKATPQRLAILKEIEQAGHIDLDTIYKNISKTFPSMSLATVYKNLHLLKEYGVIKELSIKDRKSKYEIAAQPKHHHLICKVCGEVTDIFIDTSQIDKQIKEMEGFSAEHCEVYCYGICNKCKQKMENHS